VTPEWLQHGQHYWTQRTLALVEGECGGAGWPAYSFRNTNIGGAKYRQFK